MGIFTKVFIFSAILCVISALPIESDSNEQQVDLLAAESLPVQESLLNDGTEQLVRDKRHHRHYYGGWGYSGYGGGWGYPYGGWSYPRYYGGWAFDRRPPVVAVQQPYHPSVITQNPKVIVVRKPPIVRPSPKVVVVQQPNRPLGPIVQKPAVVIIPQRH